MYVYTVRMFLTLQDSVFGGSPVLSQSTHHMPSPPGSALQDPSSVISDPGRPQQQQQQQQGVEEGLCRSVSSHLEIFPLQCCLFCVQCIYAHAYIRMYILLC